MNHKVKMTQKGFTLIELILAMTFISILLLTIALTVIQIANIYNKGIITKEVNQSSRAIADELNRSLRSSGNFSTKPGANKYVVQIGTDSKPLGGRLCVGQHSYVWNYGRALARKDANRNQYSGPSSSGNVVIESGVTRYEISFVKVADAGGALCVPGGSGKYPAVNPASAVELMRSGDHNLVLHNLTVNSFPSAKDVLSSQQLYKVSYNVGTSDIAALNNDQSLCKGPGEAGSDLNYCSVSQFTLVLRVVSGVY